MYLLKPPLCSKEAQKRCYLLHVHTIKFTRVYWFLFFGPNQVFVCVCVCVCVCVYTLLYNHKTLDIHKGQLRPFNTNLMTYEIHMNTNPL